MRCFCSITANGQEFASVVFSQQAPDEIKTIAQIYCWAQLIFKQNG